MFNKKKNLENQHILINDIGSMQGEAFQKLQMNLDFASIDDKINVIGVTSALQGDGKSTTCVNLANTYALRGKKVILVDLDLRRPTVHRYFGIENNAGLTDYCAGKIEKSNLIKKTESGLDVIVSGEKTPFPTKVLESEKLAALLKELKAEYDYVIVDTPPVIVVADAVLISKVVDGFLNVVVCGKTRKGDLKETLRIMKQNSINIIGVILTQTKIKSHGYYYYYYESK